MAVKPEQVDLIIEALESHRICDHTQGLLRQQLIQFVREAQLRIDHLEHEKRELETTVRYYEFHARLRAQTEQNLIIKIDSLTKVLNDDTREICSQSGEA